MDNNLPPYQSKLARLNVECADPALLQDCMAGQKWKCINEEGRWRKHKCKFHREVQNHLAEVNKYMSAQSKRNCACFTPDGVVYTKIKSERDVFHPKQKRFEHKHKVHNNRYKRETGEEKNEIYIDQIPPEFLDLLRMDEVVENLQNTLLSQTEELSEHTRKKREADYMTQTIDELNSVLGSIEKKYANSSSGPVQCFVEQTGKVNCSTIVYENEAAWKQSRIQIDMLIKVLKSKITNLKDIKRHLKEHRPTNMTYDEDNYENISASIEELERSEEVTETTRAPKKKTTKATTHSHRHPGTERKRKHKTSSTTTEESMNVYTTEMNEILSSSTTQQVIDDILTTLRTSTAASTTQKSRNRTKFHRTSTSTATPTSSTTESVYEDFSNFSVTSENPDDFSMSELPEVSSTTELLRATIVHDTFDSKSVTIDATIIEPKPKDRHLVNRNMNATSDSEKTHRNIPADCYCEPEFER